MAAGALTLLVVIGGLIATIVIRSSPTPPTAMPPNHFNIAVADLPKATAFYQALGYSLHPEFTGDGAACRHQRDDLRHARHACQVPRVHFLKAPYSMINISLL